jgi:hypothetical protein
MKELLFLKPSIFTKNRTLVLNSALMKNDVICTDVCIFLKTWAWKLVLHETLFRKTYLAF